MNDSVVPQSALDSLLALSREAPAGSFVEVGVFRGGSARVLNQTVVEQGRYFYLYDTFTGIPYANPELGDSHVAGDFSDTSAELVREALPNATVISGVFPDSFVVPYDKIAFVHCDCDQYRSVKAVCDVLPAHMVLGGIMIFDDYGCLAGANRAVDERFVIKETTAQGKAIVRIGVTEERK